MTKSELIQVVQKNLDSTNAEAERALNATLKAIETSVLKGEKVTLVGFGTFEMRERAARDGRNPQTGATIHIEAKRAPAAKLTFGKSRK